MSRSPRGWLGMLGLVVAIELFLGTRATSFMRPYTLDWVVAGRAASSEAPGCGVICFGDSLVKFGIAPRVLEERLGTRAYNLAVCGGQAPSSYFLLRRALDSGARPSAVVVDFTPHLLDHGPRRNLRQWPELIGLRELADLGWTVRNAGFLATLAVAELLPSVRGRDEIRQLLRSLVTSEGAPSLGAADDLRNWRANRGAQLVDPSRARRGRVRLDRWEDFPRAWSCHPVNAAYLHRFLSLAGSHGIPVFWLLPPVTPEVQARRERIGVEDRFIRFVRSTQARFPDLFVLDLRCAEFDRADFLDPLHLNRRGAAELSGDVARVLARRLSGDAAALPRWVALPGGTDRPLLSMEGRP